MTGSIAAVVGLLPAAGARSGAAPLIAFVSPQSGDYELWTVRLGGSAHERDRKFLFELLVPAEQHQLAAVCGATERYDVEIRPGLVVETMRELQAAGVEPDIWKIEGFERREDCLHAAAQARTDGRDNVACIVLGRGANQEKVAHWLRQGAGVPGYVGFAVGRTLWWDELVRYVAGEIDRRTASEEIARNYRSMIEAYALDGRVVAERP